MIAYVRGVAAELTESSVIVETAGGVAYELFATPEDIEATGIGEEVRFYTYLQVKEDGVALYGFLSRQDLAVFKLLITVSGVGPKSGLAILSAVGTDELRVAIATEDVKRISSAQGVGKKTAERLIVELKDKISVEEVVESFSEKKTAAKPSGTAEERALRESVMQVLVALGYSQKEALTAVNAVELTEGMTEDELTKLSLRQLG